MENAKPKQWGCTPPVSTAHPTEKDLQLNQELIDELKRQNNFESPEESQKRHDVLATLQMIVTEFVKLVGTQKGLPPSIIDNAGGKVFTFGSFRLGVYGPGSDIDTLVVAPKHVTRSDFFEHFPPLLEKMSAPEAIEELTPVPDAHVPIIKLEYSGISIDMIFASLNRQSVPLDMDLKDNSLLRGLDETDLRSVNGTRVTDEILDLVPQVKTFRHALRAIKLWAQSRAIYGNVIGFPGGVAWAMMVARICQLYPAAAASVVVSKFFYMIQIWPWPRPIMLKDIEQGPLAVRVWNPQLYPSDKRHIMPIITPAYPSMCATHNITFSTKEVIQRELMRANEICSEIFDGKKQWKDLFERHTFFPEGYKYYLSIVSASRTKEAQQIWSGLVQSKVRRLVSGIETSDAGVKSAHPFNKGFDRVHRCKNEDEVDEVLRGVLAHQITETTTTDQTKDVKQHAAAQDGVDNNMQMPVNGTDRDADGEQIIYTTTYYVGLELKEGSKSLDLSHPTGDFKRQCTEWPQYDHNLNSIRVIHTRNYDLPDDVFIPGETKPSRSKKKHGKSKEQANNQQTLPATKRKFAETGLQGVQTDVKRRQSSNGVVTPTPAG